MISSDPRILIVEEDDAVSSAMERVLQVSGFSTRVFSSGKQILAATDLTEADCLVLQMDLPDMNGFDVRRRLAEKGLAIPVIYTTAWEIDGTWGLLRGIQFLRKPFLARVLVEAINQALVLN